MTQSLHNCPICKKDFSYDDFKTHLDTHFTKTETGLVQLYSIDSTPNKEIVDAVCTDALSEIYKTFLVTSNQESRKLTAGQSFKAGLHITNQHLTLLHQCLDKCQDATLSPKHRQIKKVLPHWLLSTQVCIEVLQDTDDERNMVSEAKTMMGILGDFHTILHESTALKKRKEVVEKWVSFNVEG